MHHLNGGTLTVSRSTRPNLLIILPHDLGDWLGCYGHPHTHTPSIDRIADEGARFTRYFASAPICCPARAAMMTGCLPHQTGVLGQINRGWDLREDYVALARMFRDAGYRTHLIGFSHECLDTEREGFQVRHDIEQCEMATAARAACEDAKALAQPFFITIATHWLHRPYSGDYDPDLVDKLTMPPYVVHNDRPSRIDQACFLHEIETYDRHVGEVLQVLEERRELDDTLVVFTSDHGPALPRAKTTLYDPGCRVALLMRLPGRVPKGVHDALLSNVDLAPTLTELCGVEWPREAQPPFGKSFARVFQEPVSNPGKAVFMEHTYGVIYYPARAIRTDSFKLIVNFEPRGPIPISPDYARRVGHDLVNHYYSAPLMPEELYDLADDPNEFVNLANHPGYCRTRNELREKLHRVMHETNDPLLLGPIADPSGNHTPNKTAKRLWSLSETGIHTLDLSEFSN